MSVIGGTVNGPTEEDWAELRLMRWGDKRRMGWSLSKTPRPCVTCETMIEVGIPTMPAPGAVLCGPCAASWWDHTRDRYAFACVPENELHGMCMLTFNRWAEKRSARCRRRKATRARHELRSVTAVLLEKIAPQVPSIWSSLPRESQPRIFEAPRRKGHTLAEIEELKRRGQW